MSRVMKDSGIPWIGEIPKEWMFLRFKFAGKFVKGKLPETSNNENIGLPIIGASEILGKECRLYTEDVNIPTCTLNDVIILWDGANAGITATNLEGVISSTAVKYSCKDNRVYKKYMAFLMKYAEYYFKEKVGGTTIPHMNIEYINDFPLLSPTLDEQQAIADFLDVKCAEVDELIALQEKMIDELKVYKQSVITEAVTKGLNPDAPLKDSGIEWIGQIPEHWSVDKCIRMFCIIGSGTTPKFTNEENIEGQINWIQSGDINGGLLQESKYKISDKILKLTPALKIYNSPFIIIAMYGASVGNISLSEIDGCVNQACCVLSKANTILKFSFYSFRSAKDYLVQKAIGSGQPNINQEVIRSFWLPNPNTFEQQQIADYLDTKCSEIDEMTSIKQQKIEQLKEYKKSIIYEYVTGKKQVNIE